MMNILCAESFDSNLFFLVRFLRSISHKTEEHRGWEASSYGPKLGGIKSEAFPAGPPGYTVLIQVV